uniref:Cyclic AMP-dependent transcription factor ATF-4 n=1 Tax=Scophthalmus maximus TaxID=52904 RepID=A0A8D3DMN1_SCOMX
MTLSQLALEDVEALYLEPSFLMADPMGPLLDQDVEEEALSPSSSLEGKAPASPPLSFAPYTSSLSPYQTLSSSPPPSPPPPPPTHISSFLGTKAGVASHLWLDASVLLDAHIGADVCKDDAFAGMDWMSEKIDLSEFDLVSLIGSCSSDDSPSSPEDLLASLDAQMDLDLDSYDSAVPTSPEGLELGLELPGIPVLPLELPLPEAAEETEMVPDREVDLKSEPPSPPPASPALTPELGSEVDVADADEMATIIPEPSESIQATSTIVHSPANNDEPALISLPEPSIKTSPPSSDAEDDSGIDSLAGSPPRLPSPPHSPMAGSSRTKPYSKPEASSPSAKAPKNKTAATRYRQKKRVEQDLLNTECDELEKRNQELAEKADAISREIQYLKDLMEEVRKHRRTKSSSPVAVAE